MTTYPEFWSDPSFEMEDLIGKTFDSVVQDDDRIIMTSVTGDKYFFHHFQNCCEFVTIKEIVGDLNDLVGTPIVEAEEACSGSETTESEYGFSDHETWTFYKLGTMRGHVNISWYGSSNGYYSESVDKTLVKAKKDE